MKLRVYTLKIIFSINLVILASCSDGSSSGSDGNDNPNDESLITFPVVDIIPDPIIISAVNDVDINTEIDSAIVTVTGISESVDISITGGLYSIDGGMFINIPSIVNNGQQITVRLTSSSSYLTTTEAIVSVGGATATFSVTTRRDRYPIAQAGSDIRMFDNSHLNLDASNSRDYDGQIVTYLWELGEQICDGVNNVCTEQRTTLSVDVSISLPVSSITENEVNYTIYLTVTDDDGLISTDSLLLTIVKPIHLSISATPSYKHISVSWPVVANASSYVLSYFTRDKKYQDVDSAVTVFVNGNNFEHANLDAGLLYTYTVVAAVNGVDTYKGSVVNVNPHAYLKLDTDGFPLADQAADFVSTEWSCVYDEEAEVMWEVKSNDGGLRDKSWTYSWYNTDSFINGFDHGIGDTGLGTTTLYQDGLGYSVVVNSDNCFYPEKCDTQKYVVDVNELNVNGLCGYSDWRMPEIDELISLIKPLGTTNTPMIDSDYFPNTNLFFFWSDTPSIKNNFGSESYKKRAEALSYSSSSLQIPQAMEKYYQLNIRLIRTLYPENIRSKPGFKNNIISWDTKKGASEYNLYWSTTNKTPGLSDNKISVANNTSYLHQNLTPNTIYYYAVSAVINNKETKPSLATNAMPHAYVKLGDDGVKLIDQTQPYDVQSWSCVTDEHTGLTWEVKESATGLLTLRSPGYEYVNDHDPSLAGIFRGGSCMNNGKVIPISDTFNEECTTTIYINNINSLNSGAGLCNFNDWRLPTSYELIKLNRGRYSRIGVNPPVINNDYFPNTSMKNYWTATLSMPGSSLYDIVAFYLYNNDYPMMIGVTTPSAVRLVRGGLAP